MKALAIAVTFAVLSTATVAGAGRDAIQPAVVDAAAATVMADASRLKPATLSSLNGVTHWSPAPTRQAPFDFDALAAQVDLGSLLVVLGLAGLVLARPVGRTLRRHEQHRRATALASALERTPHG
jgi:hypothetical protein